ncbi:corrinoid protein [Desulfosarcina sp.]|nr:corrinoid protein [Desulfosarcina sp.]
MNDLLEQIGHCVEFGKINKSTPFPPEMKGMDGADELAKKALDTGIEPNDVLQKALVPAMERVGKKFSEKKIFVPQMLMSAKAMSMAMEHLKPFFQSGEVKRKGIVIIGTVVGDLHDIGKNLAAMMIEGSGWEIIDLGSDIKTEQFISELEKHPGAIVGLSALLTTTMANMEAITKQIKEEFPGTRVLIGGAPVTEKFKTQIGADFYAPEPQSAVEFLNNLTF